MIYNSWTVQPNISMRLSSVPHKCWCCKENFFGFLRIFNVEICPWRGMAYHGGSHFSRVCVICMGCASIYISVCRKISGVIRCKGFVHVPMVSCIALD